LDGDPWHKRIVIGSVVKEIDTRTDSELTLFGQPLVLQSRFYLFANERWVVHQHLQAQTASAATAAEAGHISMSTDDYQAMEFMRMQVANKREAAEFEMRQTYILAQLGAMRDLLAEHGIDFMVVAYPDEFQVDRALRQAVIDRYQVDESTYEWDRPQVILSQFTTANNIEFYDMLLAFQNAHEQGLRLYLPNDSHWNSAGNDLAARFLVEKLTPKIREKLN
jgi:tRNA uridine 5-carbamoylmethylation protein Kti12